MDKGDIVLITFPFTDLSGNKLRPAVVLADTSLDLTVCFITAKHRLAGVNRCFADANYNKWPSKAVAYPDK